MNLSMFFRRKANNQNSKISKIPSLQTKNKKRINLNQESKQKIFKGGLKQPMNSQLKNKKNKKKSNLKTQTSGKTFRNLKNLLQK